MKLNLFIVYKYHPKKMKHLNKKNNNKQIALGIVILSFDLVGRRVVFSGAKFMP